MRIGHRAINLGLPMFEAIDKAAEIGFEGITLMVREGWIEPEQAQADGCAEVRQRIEDNGLELSALTGSFGSMADAEAGDVARDRGVTVVQTAAAMGVDLVTSHIGVISEDLDCDDMKLMLERVGVVCEAANDVGVTVCVETGPEECWVLRDFIERLGSPRLRVNCDPANLVMKGFDHVQGVYDLAPYIVHTHAKEACATPVTASANSRWAKATWTFRAGWASFGRSATTVGCASNASPARIRSVTRSPDWRCCEV